MDFEHMNRLQKGIVAEWMEGIEKDSSSQSKRKLMVAIGRKFGVSAWTVGGIVKLAAIAGLERKKNKRTGEFGISYEPVNLTELTDSLEKRVSALERRFEHVLESIERVVRARQSYEIYVEQLGAVGRQLRGRSVVDFGERR